TPLPGVATAAAGTRPRAAAQATANIRWRAVLHRPRPVSRRAPGPFAPATALNLMDNSLASHTT
ncbi:hypothetical protein, partial [Streptomyces griseolus]|uniref:hypothetical protein n=1 Tax=Streptomyces griseolus TaxID=1909 RepID=UPI002243EA59